MAEPDDIAPLLMNQADYARHRGVSKQAIGKLVGSKIRLDENGMIDVAATDLALGEIRERVTEPRGDENGASAQLTRAKTAGAIYDARLAQLKYEREVGNIVPVAGVADAAANCGEQIVRMISGSLSARADAFVGHAKDVPTMRSFLKGIETDMLGKISEMFSKMAAEAVAQDRAEPGDDMPATDAPTLFGDQA